MSKLSKFKKAATPISKQEEIKKVELAMESQSAQTTFKKIPVDSIVFNDKNDYNSVDDDDGIAILADDIHRNSLLHNIVVNKCDDREEYILISGERRVKAYLLLKNDPERNKEGEYNLIQARIYHNLTDRQSLLMLDAANLQTRGSIGPEPLFRKVLNRYIENLKSEYDISEKAAVAITKNICSASQRTIENTRSINIRLLPKLGQLIDDGILSKKWSVAFFDFSEDEQEILYQIVHSTYNLPYEDVHLQQDAVKVAVKQLVEISDADKDKRGELLAKMLSIIKEKENNAPVKVSAHLRSKTDCPKYIQNIPDIKERIARLNSRKKLEALAAYESADSENSIVTVLRETSAEINSLIENIELLSRCNKQLSSGLSLDGVPLSQNEMMQLKKERKRILSGA